MPIKLILLVISLILLPTKFAYAEMVRCESAGGQYKHCPIDTTRGEVQLRRQLSSANCVQNESWGYDSRGIWVDRGCRAEFVIQGAVTNVRVESIRCESENNQYRRCPIDTSGREVVVDRQLSTTRCVINSTWGYDDQGLWVDKGCRAQFTLQPRGTIPVRPPITEHQTADNETFSLRSDNGKCLDISSSDFSARRNGGKVQLWDCHGGQNQRWWFDKGALVSSGGKCLDVHSGDYTSRRNGGLIQVWDCNNSANQKWTLNGKALTTGNSLCLDVHRPDFDSRASGAKVQLWDCNGSENQNWTKYVHSDKQPDRTTKPVPSSSVRVLDGVRYWVETIPAWAGVYYPLVDGQCPHGGNYANGNCLIHRFGAADDIRRGGHYWVRTEGGWAGVYYKQVRNECPYGGRKVGDDCQILTFN
jgi:hypothetical protein